MTDPRPDLLGALQRALDSRRQDPEFMARLRKRIAENGPILDRLAEDDEMRTPPEPSGGGPTCACVGYTTRTDYGTGIEHDVDRSSCPIHSGLTEEELGDA